MLYYSALFVPPPQRNMIVALHTLDNELRAIRDECSDIAVAQAKLQWWQTEIDRFLSGKASHPITQVLAELTTISPIPSTVFTTLLNNAKATLSKKNYATFAEWLTERQQMHSAFKLIAEHVLGYTDARTIAAIGQIDLALQLIDNINTLRLAICYNRVEFSQDELTEYGITWNDLTQLKMSATLQKLLHLYAGRAHQYYQAGLAALPQIDQHRQLASLTQARLAITLLDEIARADFPVLQQRISLTPLRKLWISWRMKRRCHVESSRCHT